MPSFSGEPESRCKIMLELEADGNEAFSGVPYAMLSCESVPLVA